jgi:hypothetical protein
LRPRDFWFPTLILIVTVGGMGRAEARATPHPQAGAAGVFSEIDARFARGEIDARTRQLWRVQAVREPAALPPTLWGLPREPPRGSATRVLVEAWRWVRARDAEGGAVHRLLSPPTDFAETLDSTRVPVRVSFAPAKQDYARTVLEAAETSWQRQVDDWGFYAPLYEAARGPYRIFVGDTGSGVAGYTSPYASNHQTPHDDCYTYVFVNPNLGSFAPATVAHELNHAMQAAMDCSEVMAYWENTAVYIEALTFPGLADRAVWAMSVFQSTPWRGLDHFEYGEGYQYGGALWNFYLADAFATPEPGPVLVRRIWEASMQDDSSNSVSYLDGTAQVLAEVDAAASVDEAFVDFCEARYFVGGADDGAHIDGASRWGHAPLSLTDRHYGSELPLGAAGTPPSDRRPDPLGSNHIVVDLPAEYQYPVQFTFDGSDMTRWAARVVRLGSDPPGPGEDLPLSAPGWSGSVTVDPQGSPSLMLVVANLGPEGFRPGAAGIDPAEYRYDITPQIPAPTLHAVHPEVLEAGQQDVLLVVEGEDFVLGRDFAVRFEGSSIEVLTVTTVRPDEVVLRVTVPRLTEAGLHDITVTNHGGASATGVGLLEIQPAPPAGNEAEGCRCGAANAAALPLGAVLPLLLWGLWYRRGRRGRWSRGDR